MSKARPWQKRVAVFRSDSQFFAGRLAARTLASSVRDARPKARSERCEAGLRRRERCQEDGGLVVRVVGVRVAGGEGRLVIADGAGAAGCAPVAETLSTCRLGRARSLLRARPERAGGTWRVTSVGCTRNTGWPSYSAPQAASGRLASPHGSIQKRVAAGDCTGAHPHAARRSRLPAARNHPLRSQNARRADGRAVNTLSARLSRALESQSQQRARHGSWALIAARLWRARAVTARTIWYDRPRTAVIDTLGRLAGRPFNNSPVLSTVIRRSACCEPCVAARTLTSSENSAGCRQHLSQDDTRCQTARSQLSRRGHGGRRRDLQW